MATKRSAFPVAGLKPGGISLTECTVDADGAPNVNLDCDEIFPNNEPDIEVDPADPLHMIATFHGDYINISYGSDGVANVVWTDMREFDADLDGFLQFIYFARMS
jgi:hypothetical protein